MITAGETKLMRGTEPRGVIKRGRTFKVLQVEDPWLGAHIDVDGKTIKAWVWNRHVLRTGVTDASGEERRSFSYEPAPTYRGPEVGRGARQKRRSHIYRRLHPGTGFWN